MDEARSILAEKQAALNARPLTYIEEGTETVLLRPIDLMGSMGATDFAFFEPFDFADVDYQQGRLGIKDKAYELWRKSHADFARGWRNLHMHYIPSLRERTQKEHKQKNFVLRHPQVGDIVTVATPNCPPGIWPVARVTELIKDFLGNVRTVKIKTRNGNILERSLKLLCPLEGDLWSEKPKTSSTSTKHSSVDHQKSWSDAVNTQFSVGNMSLAPNMPDVADVNDAPTTDRLLKFEHEPMDIPFRNPVG